MGENYQKRMCFYLNRKELRKLVNVTEQKADKPVCDATRLLGNAEAFMSARSDLESLCKKLGAYDTIVSPDGLGLVLGTAVATIHQSGFVAALRLEALATGEDGEAKPHEVRCRRSGSKVDQLGIPAGAIKPGQRVIIVDDILASGATTLALASAVEELGGKVIGVVTLAEMTPRHGKMLLEARGYAVRSVLRFGG